MFDLLHGDLSIWIIYFPKYEAIHHLVEGEREVAWADQIPNDSQLITDPDKPLLDHILKFPTLGCKLKITALLDPQGKRGAFETLGNSKCGEKYYILGVYFKYM